MASIFREIADARKAAGLSQESLAKNAGVDRTTIVNLEAGKGATTSTLENVIRTLGFELHLRPVSGTGLHSNDVSSHRRSPSAARDEVSGRARSKLWKLSFPYDWANPHISEDALIVSVLKASRVTDVARVCYLHGFDRVERVMKEKIADPYVVDEAKRVLRSVHDGFERAEQGVPAARNA